MNHVLTVQRRVLNTTDLQSAINAEMNNDHIEIVNHVRLKIAFHTIGNTGL